MQPTNRERLASLSLHDDIKTYYQENADSMAEVFFEANCSWGMLDLIDPQNLKRSNEAPKSHFQNANYSDHDELFKRIKKLAEDGNIIATLGSIDDLSFLKNASVALIDVSNILDYCALDFSQTLGIGIPIIRSIMKRGSFAYLELKRE